MKTNLTIYLTFYKLIFFKTLIIFLKATIKLMGDCVSQPPTLCLASGPDLGPQARPLPLVPNLYLSALAPSLFLPALAPNLYLPALASTLCLPALVPNLYLTDLASTLCLPQICIYQLSLGSEFAYTDLVSPVLIYWPWPTICTHAGC